MTLTEELGCFLHLSPCFAQFFAMYICSVSAKYVVVALHTLFFLTTVYAVRWLLLRFTHYMATLPYITPLRATQGFLV